jgi:maleylacetate reductase
LPILAIPTTYAGSEMTPIYGITEAGLKKTGRDVRVLPRTVIYDPELSAGLPLALSVTSGINAMAHAAEGLYAADANPIMSMLAEEGIRALAEGCRASWRSDDIDARSHCLYGAWLCGTVLGNVGMSLHHKLCHTLGAATTCRMPRPIRDPAACAGLQRTGCAPGDAAHCPRAGHGRCRPGRHDLAARLQAPPPAGAGHAQEALERCADIALQNAYANPRALERAALLALLEDAWEGRRPQRAVL